MTDSDANPPHATITAARCGCRGRRIGSVVAIAIAVASSAFAGGESPEPFSVVASVARTMDSNLFKLAPGTDPVTATGRDRISDTLETAIAGIRIDKLYAQQRFQVDLTENRYRHDNFTHLNFDGFDYRAAWLWHVTPRVSGVLSTEHKQALVSYQDFRTPRRNVRATDTRIFNLEADIGGGLKLLAAASRKGQISEVPFLADADFRSTAREAGLRYESAAGNSVTLNARATRGRYVNRDVNPVTVIDDAYEDREAEIKATWILTGNLTLDGRWSRLVRRNDHFAARDYAGPISELSFVWTPVAKLRTVVSAKSDLSPALGDFSSYRRNSTISLAPTWQITTKSSVVLSLDRTRSDFRGPVVISTTPLRRDLLRNLSVVGTVELNRNLSVLASIQRQHRVSNDSNVEFVSRIVNLSLASTF